MEWENLPFLNVGLLRLTSFKFSWTTLLSPFHLGGVSCCKEGKVAKFQGETLREAEERDTRNADKGCDLKDIFLLPDLFRCFSL